MYPTPDKLQAPSHDDLTPDQEQYLVGLAQHNRLWVAFIGMVVICVALLGTIVTMTIRFQPTSRYYTLDGGYLVEFNDRGNPVVDSVEYVPARMRAMVKTFADNRYGYDYQSLFRLNTALRLMTADAAKAEQAKLTALDLANTVVGSRMHVELDLDYINMTVAPKGKGSFEVTIKGFARITDAIRNTDPQHPAEKPVTITLLVATVPASDVNPLGFVITATGKDIL